MKASYLQPKKEGVCTNPGIQGCPAMPLKAITSTRRRDLTRNGSKTALDSAFGLPAPFTVSQPDDVSMYMRDVRGYYNSSSVST